MCILALISTFGSLILVMAQQSSTESASEDTGVQFKMIIALIVAIVLIVTILVIVIIILFALSGKGKKKRQQHLGNLANPSKRKASEKKGSNSDNYNMVFAAKGQPVNEKAKNDVGASGSFIFSGYSSDKPIPIEETYATSLQNTDASESGVFERRPTDLKVKPPKPKNSKSVVIKDNKSKTGV